VSWWFHSTVGGEKWEVFHWPAFFLCFLSLSSSIERVEILLRFHLDTGRAAMADRIAYGGRREVTTSNVLVAQGWCRSHTEASNVVDSLVEIDYG